MDRSTVLRTRLRTAWKAALKVPAQFVAAPIVLYRRWISPALPARCRFYPSCSAYALEAVQTHGAIKGLGLAIWRLLRCHPFHPGGFDPVPPRRGVAAEPKST